MQQYNEYQYLLVNNDLGIITDLKDTVAKYLVWNLALEQILVDCNIAFPYFLHPCATVNFNSTYMMLSDLPQDYAFITAGNTQGMTRDLRQDYASITTGDIGGMTPDPLQDYASTTTGTIQGIHEDVTLEQEIRKYIIGKGAEIAVVVMEVIPLSCLVQQSTLLLTRQY